MANWITYCRWASTIRRCRQLSRSIHMGRVVPEIDPDLEERILDKSVDAKRLITRRKIGFTPMPAELFTVAENKLSEYSDKQFRLESKYLLSILRGLKLPDDEVSLNIKRKDIKTELVVRDKIVMPEADEEGFELGEELLIRNRQLHDLIEGKVQELRRDWHYYEYDERAAMMYMATRLAPNYACLRTVMREIHTIDPDFVPKSVLDFGSGMGTTIFAVNETWPDEVNEFLNVDISKEQQSLCEYLLRGGSHFGEVLQRVFHRQYLPSSNRVRYDMVVAAFSMLELPNSQLRINTIENLWNKTNDLLVIIERGNKGGFQIIDEARNFVLDSTGHDVTKKLNLAPRGAPVLTRHVPTSHVLAPCAHEFLCPRSLMTSKKDMNTCRFPIYYEPLEFGAKRPGTCKEEFAYVVLRKRPREDTAPMRWPRVVEPRRRPGKMVIHRLCCPNGSLAETVITKEKYGKAAYEVAKATHWGDLLPVKISDTYEPRNSKLLKDT